VAPPGALENLSEMLSKTSSRARKTHQSTVVREPEKEVLDQPFDSLRSQRWKTGNGSKRPPEARKNTDVKLTQA